MRTALLLQMALADVGRIAEVPGDGDHPYIRYAHSLTTLGESPDSVPWCSSWLNAKCHEAGLPRSRSALARSWARIGREVADRQDWQAGDIAVFSRGDPPSGHVAIVLALVEASVWVVGANQQDAVTVTAFPVDRLIALRRVVG